jgi:hypothetical protein
MQNSKTIYQLHEEHKIWLNKLAFYKDEVSIMKNRIAEIAQKNTSKEVLSFVEHFQNQLIIQNEQIDILKHNIGKHESSLESAANKNPVAVDHEKFDDHSVQRENMDTFEKIFNELRKELIGFLSKWM